MGNVKKVLIPKNENFKPGPKLTRSEAEEKMRNLNLIDNIFITIFMDGFESPYQSARYSGFSERVALLANKAIIHG